MNGKTKPSENLANRILRFLEETTNESPVVAIYERFKHYYHGTVWKTIEALVDAKRIKFVQPVAADIERNRRMAEEKIRPKIFISGLRVRMPKRETVYIPPGIYGVGIMEIMFPPDKFRVIVTDDKKKWNA